MRCIKIIKEGRRRRYIGFEIKTKENKTFEKNDIINSVRKNSEEICNKHFKEMGLFVVRFNGKQGIIRCRHTEKENAIDLLKRIDRINDEKVKIETIATSGTIKALIKKHMSNFDI